MTICLVSDSYPCTRPHGGVAVYTQTAARALAARGHAVHVLVSRRPGVPEYSERDFADGLVQVHYREVRWLPVIGSLMPALGESFGVADALAKLHAQFHFDIVEFPNFEGLGFVSQIRRIAPVVVRLHTSMLELVEVQDRSPNLGERFMMWMERMSVKMARGVVTHSTPHRDKIASLFGLKDITVIPHGIVIPSSGAIRREAPVVLSIGRLTARKGGSTLLAAAALTLQQMPEARFMLVGSDGNHPLARQFRSEYPEFSEGNVNFLGFVNKEELNALFDQAQVYASASVYESFGLPFVEAMARGIPVVGCATSAMNEIIGNERTGLLVPPREPAAFAGALLRLLHDPDLRTRFGAEGRKTVEEKYSDAAD
jgi:glycosyltransferase involved in cell wall biosynthesis